METRLIEEITQIRAQLGLDLLGSEERHRPARGLDRGARPAGGSLREPRDAIPPAGRPLAVHVYSVYVSISITD